MKCPKCGGKMSVVDTRPSIDGSVRRRRKCGSCLKMVTSYEISDVMMARYTKRANAQDRLINHIVALIKLYE